MLDAVDGLTADSVVDHQIRCDDRQLLIVTVSDVPGHQAPRTISSTCINTPGSRTGLRLLGV